MSERLLALNVSVQPEPEKRVRIKLNLAFGKVQLPPRGLWKTTRELAGVEARVQLNGGDVTIHEHSPPTFAEVQWKEGSEHARTTEVSGGVEDGVTAGVKRGSERRQVEEESGTAKREIVTASLFGPREVQWVRFVEPGGHPFLIGSQDLWAVAVETGPAAPRFQVTAKISSYKLLASDGKPLSSLKHWGVIAKLLGSDSFDRELLAPVVTSISS